MLDEWRSHGGIAAASYEGARGHPLVVGRAGWDAIPDVGLRDRAVRLVPCDDFGAPGDVDVPDVNGQLNLIAEHVMPSFN